MTAIAWTQLSLVVVICGVLIGAAGFALVARPTFSWLRRITPRIRFVLLALLASVPALAGIGALAVAFAPSVLDAIGLVADHCAYHPGHEFHLCFVHGTPPAISVPVVFATALLVGFALRRSVAEMVNIRRSLRWASRLRRLSAYDDEIGGWAFPSENPLALSVGFLRPAVFVSDSLRRVLTDQQLGAVLEHERAHARRFDAVVKLAARLLASLHVAETRERLLREIELAGEQACDEAAARAVGDRLTVAEAILALQRHGRQSSLPTFALGFGAGFVERRVHGMVDDDWQRPGLLPFAVLGVATSLVVTQYNALHHLAESILPLLF